MATFQICLAQSVRIYGNVEVEADTMADAIEKLRAASAAYQGPHFGEESPWDAVSDVDYSTTSENTIVTIEAEDGTICDDIPLFEDDSPWRTISAERLRAYLKGRSIGAPEAEGA